MRTFALGLLISLTIFQNALSQNFYDINTINTVELIFSQSNWDAILDSLKAAGNDERLAATAIISGVQFDSVGVRYKGNSSYSPNRVKNPLNIKLDYIFNDQLLDGYGTLKLANGFKDPSQVREVLSYEIARNYMPACLANYCNVYINGSLIGLYSSVQDVDKYFMRTHFHSDENVRFKGESSGGPSLTTVWGYFGPDSTNYFNYYELESDKGWYELINFLDTLNNNNTSVEEVLNVDRHLWMLAFDILMVNLDSPVNFGHNYYLYKDGTRQFNPIIWDMNENFGAFSMLLNGGPLNLTQMQQLTSYLNENSSNYPIINKILSNPVYKKVYVAHMKTIMEEVFSNGWYLTRALELQSIIDAAVQADPNKLYTYNDFISNIYNTVGSGPPPAGQSIVGVTQLMDARVIYLNTLPEYQATAPEISNVSHTPANPNPNATVWFNATVNNAAAVMLAHRSSSSSRFEKTAMFDDGNHNDGAAGDGIYGVSLVIGSTDVQYYIYAENNDAVKFSPVRAEYECYSIGVSGDLVINEFMADNDTVVPDPSGEYDDWIELYNNSNVDIPLLGYYLSDDGTDLLQWAFPDTFIAANNYLIIWADNDLGQVGLHANFKISASGESLYLVSSDTTIIDEVVFGTQQTDISFGRYPNGTGNFIEMTPSFAAENLSGIVGIEDNSNQVPSEFILEQNYPNPFNPSTTIVFSFSKNSTVSLEIFNLLGQRVATLVTGNLRAGKHTFLWNADDKPSGVYFCKLTAGSHSQMIKMMLMR